MYFFFTDETNLVPSQGDFFIYGGIVATAEQIPALHDIVVAVRTKYGFNPEDSLKFHTRSRPAHVSFEDWTSAKFEVIEAAEGVGVDLLSYVVLHAIARQSQEKILEWALNALIAHFDLRYLAEKTARGAVCLDRLDEKFSYPYLRNIFATGAIMPDGRIVKLQRVIHYSLTCDGASHVSSVIDIALGGLRYCVNTGSGGPGSTVIAARIFPPLARMMWSVDTPAGRKIGGYGFIQYPKEIRVPDYEDRYVKLRTALALFAGY